MGWFDIIFLFVVTILVAYSVFIAVCEEYNLLVSFRMRKKKELKEFKEFKEWNRQRNNKTRELKKQIKDWNKRRVMQKKRRIIQKKRAAIHKKNWAFLQKLNFLKIIYGLIAFIIGLALFTLFSALLSQLLTKQFNAPNPFNLPKLEVVDSSFALAFLGTVTGIVALFSGYLAIRRSEEDKIQNKIAQKQAETAIRQSNIAFRQSRAATAQSRAANRQADIAEQGLITDRINKAVESLGKINQDNKPVLEVRIGALYALERIAQDSIADHIRIMKIICSYIRINRPFNNKMAETEAITDDIREALHIIGHRDKWTEDERHLNKEKKENYKLDLRHCDLHNLELFDADLSNALLDGSTLREAILVRVKFKSAHFFETNISDADIEGADMTDVTTVKAYAHRGDFSDCLTFTQPQIDKMFLGKGVKLAKNVKIDEDLFHPQKGTTYYKKYNTFKNFMEARHEWLEESEN